MVLLCTKATSQSSSSSHHHHRESTRVELDRVQDNVCRSWPCKGLRDLATTQMVEIVLCGVDVPVNASELAALDTVSTKLIQVFTGEVYIYVTSSR